MDDGRDWFGSARAWIIGLACLIVVVIVYYVAADRTTPFTTDAYVQTFVVQVAPRVDGQVVEVLVRDGSSVKAGDPLFRLDNTPYKFAAARLSASLAVAQSNIKGLRSRLDYFNAVVKQRQADVKFAQVTYDRIAKLAEESFAAQQKLDQATDALRTNKALLSQAKADVVDIETKLDSMVGDEHSKVAEARAHLRIAEYDLKHTTIHAAVDGVIDNMQLQTGTYLKAGDRVMSLIDSQKHWVVANYKENALSVIKPGQKVKLSYFMYPGRIFDGEVSEIGSGVYRGQGLADGLLANIENPSAWITESQRFEVRIDPKTAAKFPLRVGSTARVMVVTGNNFLMNGLGLFWLWVGAQLDYIY